MAQLEIFFGHTLEMEYTLGIVHILCNAQEGRGRDSELALRTIKIWKIASRNI
jgi:hypothetical protein